MKFLADGKSFSKVAAVRKQIAEIQDEITSLDRAPLPAQEAKQRIRDWLAGQQADQGLALHLVGWALTPDRSANGPRGMEGWEIGGNRPPVDLMREVMRLLAVVAPQQIE